MFLDLEISVLQVPNLFEIQYHAYCRLSLWRTSRQAGRTSHQHRLPLRLAVSQSVDSGMWSRPSPVSVWYAAALTAERGMTKRDHSVSLALGVRRFDTFRTVTITASTHPVSTAGKDWELCFHQKTTTERVRAAVKGLLKRYVRVRIYGESELVAELVAATSPTASAPKRATELKPSGSRSPRLRDSRTKATTTYKQAGPGGVPCFARGCSKPAVWAAHQLYGKRQTVYACESHKPPRYNPPHAFSPVVTEAEIKARLQRDRDLLPAVGYGRSIRALQGGRIDSNRRRH